MAEWLGKGHKILLRWFEPNTPSNNQKVIVIKQL